MDRKQIVKVLLQVGGAFVPAGNILADGIPKLLDALEEVEPGSTADTIAARVSALAGDGVDVAADEIGRAQDVIRTDAPGGPALAAAEGGAADTGGDAGKVDNVDGKKDDKGEGKPAGTGKRQPKDK